MVQSKSKIIKNIHSDQSIKCEEKIYGIRTSTWDAKAHDLRQCGLKIGLRETKVQEVGSQICTINLKKIGEFFIHKALIAGKMDRYDIVYEISKRRWQI